MKVSVVYIDKCRCYEVSQKVVETDLSLLEYALQTLRTTGVNVNTKQELLDRHDDEWTYVTVNEDSISYNEEEWEYEYHFQAV